MGSLVVAGSNCFKSFLAGCVPNLELDCFLVNVDSSDLEVDTDGWHKVVREDIVLFAKIS